MIFSIFVAILVWFVKNCKNPFKYVKGKMIATSIIIFQTFLPSIINLNAQSVSCLEIYSNKYFLKFNTMISCDSQEFLNWVLKIPRIFFKFFLEKFCLFYICSAGIDSCTFSNYAFEK